MRLVSFFLTLLVLLPSRGALADTAGCGPVLERLATPFGTINITSPTAADLMRDQTLIARALGLKGTERKEALKTYFEQRPRTRVQVVATLANYAMAMWMGGQIALGFAADPGTLLVWTPMIPPTLLLTDFMSALLHKFLDSFGSERNPLWGSATRAFRVHHEFPSNLNELSYLNNVAAFGKMLAPLYLGGVVAQPFVTPEIGASTLLMLMIFSNGTEFHRQAHLSNPQGWIKKLQSWRVILNHRDHLRHHHAPTDSDFGIVNGWSNYLVPDSFWTRLDWAVWSTLKRMPHNWIQNPEAIPDSVIAELRNNFELIPQELLVAAMNPRNAGANLDELLQLWIRNHPLEEGTTP